MMVESRQRATIFLSSIWVEAVLHPVWGTFYGVFVLTAYNNVTYLHRQGFST